MNQSMSTVELLTLSTILLTVFGVAVSWYMYLLANVCDKQLAELRKVHAERMDLLDQLNHCVVIIKTLNS